MAKGNISVNSENIFPVIKKWLYSEKDIFLRELVSNACDAVTKHRRLVSLGEAKESAKGIAVLGEDIDVPAGYTIAAGEIISEL